MNKVKVGDIHYTINGSKTIALTVKSVGRKFINYDNGLRTQIGCKSKVYDARYPNFSIYPPVSISKEIFDQKRKRMKILTYVRKYFQEHSELSAFSIERLEELEQDIINYKIK
jgi:hypothetical protein